MNDWKQHYVKENTWSGDANLESFRKWSVYAPDLNNPFSFETRKELIMGSINNESDKLRISTLPIADFRKNSDWVKNVVDIVHWHVDECIRILGSTDADICLVGHKKDKSSFYLDLFPQWEYLEFGEISVHSSTHIREFLYEGKIGYAYGHVPDNVYRFLVGFQRTREYKRLVGEYKADIAYGDMHIADIHPPKFVTVDAVVVCNEHLLLIRRKNHPGKGLWAFPGGHLDPHEEIPNGIYRELSEETCLDLSSGIESIDYFADPKRSKRGRSITFAGIINLEYDKEKGFPLVVGMDDASKAKWVKLQTIENNQRKLFEDHYHIFMTMLNSGN